MSTLSVPINGQLEKFIASMVKQGRAANKAEVVRKALRQMAEDEAVAAVLEGMQDVKDGKVFRGDLDDLAARLR